MVLGQVTDIVDHVPKFYGLRELLARELVRRIDERGEIESPDVNVIQRDNSWYLIAWVRYPLETPKFSRAVVALNQENFHDSILDVSLVVDSSIVCGFGVEERVNRFCGPRVPTTRERIRRFVLRSVKISGRMRSTQRCPSLRY